MTDATVTTMTITMLADRLVQPPLNASCYHGRHVAAGVTEYGKEVNLFAAHMRVDTKFEPGAFSPPGYPCSARHFVHRGCRAVPVPVAEAPLGEHVRQGDPAACEALYKEYGPPIYDFLVRLVQDRAAAEDLVQATFSRAFEYRATLREPPKIRSWLWSIAHSRL